ncbi:nucleotidyltransferase family protein [Pelagibacterium montanilacus]|uniref:nucleotidyltransferase family protein n=1 Tax=Pelagibacterium montanilacus TaxID=2185280 RepID=UPI0013E0C9D1|nr:nucleotidyltransferase family protein [Pelagibacterium montanilacus]
MSGPDCLPAGAMLLAAGLGTRMGALTAGRPKPLIEIAGIALIDRVVAALAGEGCTRFVVNAHHHADQMAAHVSGLAGAQGDLSFALSPEAERLETGGGLRNALALVPGDPVLVANTDSFWLAGSDTPLARMAARYGQGDADIVLLCTAPRRARGLSGDPDFHLLPDGGLVDTGAGQPVHYAGVALVDRALAASGPEGPFSLYRHFVAAREAGRLKGVLIEAPWYHVGDAGGLAQAETALGDDR